MRGLRTWVVVGSLSSIFALACSRDLGTGPLIPTSPSDYVGVSKDVANIGCAVVVRDGNGALRTAVVSRGAVEGLVGRLDSIPTRIINGRRSAKHLQVLSATVRPGNRQQAYRISCLETSDATNASFARLIAMSAHNPVWNVIDRNLVAFSGPSGNSDVGLASHLLLAPLTRGISATGIRLGSLRTSQAILSPGSIRKDTYDCHHEMDYACNSATLPTITVTATPNTNSVIVVDMSELYYFMSEYPAVDMNGIVVYVINGPTCQNYSDMYMALQDEIDKLEVIAGQMEAAMRETAAQTCQGDLTEGGYDYCVDLFIMSPQAAFFVGDNRTFDPNAPYKASRAQIYINPETCEVRKIVNTSRLVTTGPFLDSVAGPHKLNEVTAHRLSDGSCQVVWKLYNGYCWTLGNAFGCPAIDGSLTFTHRTDGTFWANISEDRYPSRGLYRWDPSIGEFQTISERREGVLADLVDLRQQITNIQLKQQQNFSGSGCGGIQ